jgi:ABC-2 type transport system ATP-binding protein
MNVLFQTLNVTKQFAEHKALSEVSITVPEQSIYGLLGPNGAGKTTLIRLINQMTIPDSGELFFRTRKLKPEDIFRIGYLPEERGLYKKMKVGEQALYLARLKGLSKPDALKRLKFWFEKFEIEAWWNKKVEELSKGMQQKVQFIVTVIHEPELLIFDEPFSGFDPINVNLIKDEILDVKKRGGTIIFSTHNMASVEELCDTIALINKSKKILEGRVSNIKSEYRTNTYEITYAGNQANFDYLTPDKYKIVHNKSRIDADTVVISILNGRSPNELLADLLPNMTILSFHEILPTMHDIFIKKVKESD